MSGINWEDISSYKGPGSSPGFILWQVSCEWRRRIEQTLREFNLTHSQFVVLATLGWMKGNGTKVTQVEIATATKIDVATTSQILRYLEKKGLVRRRHIKGDIRAKYPYLTSDGQNIIKESLPKVESEDKRFFEPLKNNKSTFVTRLITLILG